MARPAALQFLRSGLVLTRKAFPGFVNTWNWLVGAFDSMVGDAEVNGDSGFIIVDRTNPDKPVIRFDSSKIKQSGEGGDEKKYVEDIGISADGEWIAAKIGGEWVNKIRLVKHSEV